MNKTELTIVVPLFNQEEYIQECIESILNQSLENIQILIINDGSTDESLKVCEKMASQDQRIKIISQENRGLIEARLTGIQNTNTEYITFVDADDFILPDAYKNAEEHMNNGIEEIFFEISRYYDKHTIKREYHIIEEGIYDKNRICEEVYPKLLWNFERATPGIECSQCVRIIKTELLRDEYSRLQSNQFYYGEDAIITYPLMTRIKSMAVISVSYYMHRQREKGNVQGYILDSNYFDKLFILCKYLREQMHQNIEMYNFDKQIDYYYMYSVDLKKLCYNDYIYIRNFLFPFNKVPYGMNIVLYGAGEVGRTYYNQITKLHYCKNIIWVDKNAENIADSRVVSIDILKKNKHLNIKWIVIAIENKKICEQVRNELVELKFEESKIVY